MQLDFGPPSSTLKIICFYSLGLFCPTWHHINHPTWHYVSHWGSKSESIGTLGGKSDYKYILTKSCLINIFSKKSYAIKIMKSEFLYFLSFLHIFKYLTLYFSPCPTPLYWQIDMCTCISVRLGRFSQVLLRCGKIGSWDIKLLETIFFNLTKKKIKTGFWKLMEMLLRPRDTILFVGLSD